MKEKSVHEDWDIRPQGLLRMIECKDDPPPKTWLQLNLDGTFVVKGFNRIKGRTHTAYFKLNKYQSDELSRILNGGTEAIAFDENGEEGKLSYYKEEMKLEVYWEGEAPESDTITITWTDDIAEDYNPLL